MATPNIPMTFNNVVRNPYTYLLITIVSLLWIFVYNNSSINKKNDQDRKQVTTELRNELKDERKKNDNLINSILIKQGVIEKLTGITDSLTNKNDEHQ